MQEKIKELAPYIVIVIVVIFIKSFIVTPIRVNGESMEPTLLEKDIMILNKTAYYFSNPKRFEIVVVETEDEYIIKRIIGLPGEKVEYNDDNLYINDELVEEPVEDLITEDFNITSLGSEKVPDDCYLVLGDNRGNSLDSRTLGFIKKDQILGRTSLTILPFKRIGFKNYKRGENYE